VITTIINPNAMVIALNFHYYENNENLFCRVFTTHLLRFLLRIYYAFYYIEQHVYVTPGCGFPTHPPV
jgi:hypothetical protein